MAGAPLRTARSSDFTSVRDDYSSWLDEIFPPNRFKSGEQLHHRNLSREQQASITAKLSKALPMELPQTNNKRFLAQRAARKQVPKHGQVREERTDKKLAQNMVPGSRQPLPPPRIRRSSSLPYSTFPALSYLNHRHRLLEERKCVTSTLAPPSRHPATFPDMSYSSGRSSHRPGLSFFEYVPSRALINVATTLAFLGPEAAKRTGGEVLWLRTNAAGLIQRRVFSSAGCFVSSPKLRRRVALSLCGRNKVDGAINTMRASASAPNVLRRLRLGTRGTRALPTGTSGQTKDVNQHPAALLKVNRSRSRHGGRRNNNDNERDDNGSKRKRGREEEGGGRTDVLFLDNLSNIEEALLKAGLEGEDNLSEKQPETTTAWDQGQPLPPQQPNVRLSFGNNTALGTNLEHDGAYHKTEKKSGTTPEVGTPEADEAQEMASIGDYSVPPCSTLLTESALQMPRRGLLGGVKGEVVQRARPWAIQKYLRPKGPLTWVVRVVWRRNRDSFCWILSDSDPFMAADDFRGGGVSGGASWCTAVRSIAGQAGWEAPKAFVAGIVAALEASEKSPASMIPLRFDLMAVDLIEDRDGKWWLTQVKAFRLLRPMGMPTPSNFVLPSSPAPPLCSEASRTNGGEERGGGGDCLGRYGDNSVQKDNGAAIQLPRRTCGHETPKKGGDERLQEPRCVAADEAESASLAPRVPKALPSALHETAVVATAAAVSQKTRRTKPHVSAANVRRKSSCPGLYCNSVGEEREEREQQTESTGTLPTPESRSSGDRCANADAAVDKGMARAEDTQNGETLAKYELISTAGPTQETTTVVGRVDGGNPRAGEDYPMFQLPLKALVVNDEVVRFRRALITRQQGAAGTAAGGGQDDAWDVIHATRAPMAQTLTRAPSFEAPAWTKGSDGVSLQSTSLVESRVIAALRKRDRVRLYDNVALCAVCYRDYSENWRWWLARGRESKTVDVVPPQASDAMGPTHLRPKLERARGRRGWAKQSSAAVAAIGTTAFVGADGRIVYSTGILGRSKRSVSTASRKPALSLRVSPSGPAPDNRYNSSSRSSSSGGDTRPAVTSCLRNSLSTTSGLDEGAMGDDGASTNSLGTESPAGTTAFQPQSGARNANTSTLGTFRARLDRRLEGISISRATETRVESTDHQGLKKTAGWTGGTDRQRETPSRILAVSTSDTTDEAENGLFGEAASTSSVASNADAKSIGDPTPKGSRSVAAARAPAAEVGYVGHAAAEAMAEKEAARGDTSTRSSIKPTREPADTNHRTRMWGWEKVKVDWNPKNV